MRFRLALGAALSVRLALGAARSVRGFRKVGCAFRFSCAARFSLWLYEVEQRISFRCAARFISVCSAFPFGCMTRFFFGAQRVRFGVSDGWQRVWFR